MDIGMIVFSLHSVEAAHSQPVRPTDYRIMRALTNAANDRRSNPIPELVVSQRSAE